MAKPNHEVSQAARAGLALGLSVLPPNEDGSKSPTCIEVGGRLTWEPFQNIPATPGQLDRWYEEERRTGLGFVCGGVSRGLELFEFDDRGAYDQFKELAAETGLGGLVERLESGYLEETPGGGFHWLYYCEVVRGSTKLARRHKTPGEFTEADRRAIAKAAESGNVHRPIKPLIETKGEGGYVVVAPSFGDVHPTKKPYLLLRGSIATIPNVTPEERDALWGLARSLDRLAKPPEPTRPPKADAAAPGVPPWEDFNARATWEDILDPHGWTKVYTRGDTTYWRRPGKDEGVSATTNHGGHDCLYVFTSSTVLEQNKGFDRIGAFVKLNHGGDFRAAAIDLRAKGYGDPAPAYKARARPPAGGRHEENGDGDGGDDEPPVVVGAPREPIAPRLPEIEIKPDRHRVVAETMAAIVADPDVYQRAETLVIIARQEKDTEALTARSILRNLVGAPRIIALSKDNLGCCLTRNATFYAWTNPKKGEAEAHDVHPPDWLIGAVLNHKFWPGIRPLMSIVECPYPSEDGSIFQTPGYDRETGTYYIPSIEFPPVADEPGRDDAMEAADHLLDMVHQFPFASDADRAVWLAGLLTAVARPAIAGPVPGIAVNSNRAGVGKGILVDLIGIVVWGRPIPTSSYPVDTEEANKVKTALAIAGWPLVHFDNLENGSCYGSSALDSAITSMTVNERILGFSATTGPMCLRPTWFLTGNNVSPTKDAHRRWLPCNLTTALERPEERDDLEILNIRSAALERRGSLVRDALTILRAHALNGRPGGKWSPLGSFEEWDEVIRRAVWFATGWDCGITRRAAAEDAPDRKRNLNLMDAWRKVQGKHGMTHREAIDAITRNEEYRKDNPSLYEEDVNNLKSAFLEFSRNDKLPSASVISKHLRDLADQNLDGAKFVKCTTTGKQVAWMVVLSEPILPKYSIAEIYKETLIHSDHSESSVSTPTREKNTTIQDVIIEEKYVPELGETECSEFPECRPDFEGQEKPPIHGPWHVIDEPGHVLQFLAGMLQGKTIRRDLVMRDCLFVGATEEAVYEAAERLGVIRTLGDDGETWTLKMGGSHE